MLPHMQKLSALIIAKNEEAMIRDCIQSVKFCDEIIVIDAASVDKTAAIAKNLGAKVFEFTTDDFSKARNFAKLQAKGDWLLYVDADERVSKELMVQIKMMLAKPTGVSAYRVRRKNYYFKTFEWPTTERLERLFKADSLKIWYGRLHESARVDGRIGELDGFLLHFTHRDLSEMVSKTLVWSTAEAELRLRASHPKMASWRFFRVMITAFYSSYVKQAGWKVGVAGLVESMYQSYSAFVTYAKLWELQEGKQIAKKKSNYAQ